VVKLQQFCFGQGEGSDVPLQTEDARLPLVHRA
jgi:hypothetical protein